MGRKGQKQETTDRYEVFISYRRGSGAAEARLIRAALEQHGLRVFLDVTSLGSGHFDESLLKAISEAPHFIVVLSPHAMERCVDEKDWLRQEISTAISSQRNVVPVMLPGFAFPEGLASDIADLQRYQGVEYSHTFFEATVEKILELLGAQPRRDRYGEPALTFPALGAFARRHVLGLCLVALLVAGAGTGLYEWLWNSPRARMLHTIGDLKAQFHDAVNAMVLSGPGDRGAAQPYISRAEADVNSLMQADPNNGDALYYSGELKRIKNSTLFTPKSCLIPAGLKSAPELDPYESDFFQYLDHEQKLPESEKGGSDSSDICYSRVNGYCPQRTAWINHLLANDFYDEALLTKDSKNRQQKLEMAISFAETAEKLYQNSEGVKGFSQCTATTDLIHLAKNKLGATRP